MLSTLRKSSNGIPELEKARIAISDESICSVFRGNCSECRMECVVCVDCKGLCGNKFIRSDFSGAFKEIQRFRELLWSSPEKDSCGSIREFRTVMLINDLFKMKNSENLISFTVGKDKVRVNISIADCC